MDPITLIAAIGIPLLFLRKSSNSVSTSSLPKFPKGKGLIVRYLDSYEDINNIKLLKVKWVAILSHWQDELENGTIRTKDFLINENGSINTEKMGWLSNLSDAGIQIWFWGFPNAYDIDNFIKICQKYEEKKFCKGYIFNVEESFLNTPNAADVLASVAKKRLNKPIGLISYGGGDKYVGNFPWSSFINFDFGMPQIYDKENNLGSNYPQDSFKSWSKYFKTIIPIWTISDIHTLTQAQSIANNTPSALGYGWWDYKSLKEDPVRFDFIRDFSWPNLKS